MRDAWGDLAVVEGIVKRDPRSGRPVTVRQVRAVELLPEVGPEDYKKARGLIPLGPDSQVPEEVIRKARDA